EHERANSLRGEEGRDPRPARGDAGGRSDPTRQVDLEPVPRARAVIRAAPRRHRARHRVLDRRGRGHRTGRRHDHLRGPRRRHARPRVDAARRAAAQDHHPRRRRHRAGNRGLLLSQRHAARVGAGARAADRRRADRRRSPRQRASRPLLRLPQLLWDARLRAAPGDRARGRQAVREAATRSLRRARRLLHGDGRGLRGACVRRRAGGVRGRRGVRRARDVPDPRHLRRRGSPDERLHRHGHLLPLPSAPADRPPQRARLPVALGHGLVLVLAGVRRAEPARAAAGAQAAPALEHLLEARRPREALRRVQPGPAPARTPRAGARRPGHRGSDRPRRRVLRLLRTRDRDLAVLGLPAARARPGRPLGPLRPRPGHDVRQLRLLVDRLAGRGRTRRHAQPPHRAGRGRARRAQVALLGLVLRARGVLAALQRRGVRGAEAHLRRRRSPARPLQEVCRAWL
ncbi:MAG: FAD/FMN-containing dehydrogenases, partial [uncultured Solirubrobacterales bacterium]